MKRQRPLLDQLARLHKAGLRATSARLALLTLIESDRTHPTAEELFERLRETHPSLSLSTVYKTLESFLRAGLCSRVNTIGSLRVDGVAREHDHACCRLCGRVFDVERRRCGRTAPPKLPPGFAGGGYRVEYDVICAGCRGAAAPLND